MDFLYLTLVGIVLYVLADRLLRQIERYMGREFKHRGLYFFAILLTAALVSFALIRRFLGS